MLEKMNPEAKELWVYALRSGEFRQGQKKLRTVDDEYCCLGVLCEVHRRATRGAVEWASVVGGDWYRYHERSAFPPALVRSWAALPDSVQDHLVKMNDAQGAPFDMIADYIEEYL